MKIYHNFSIRNKLIGIILFVTIIVLGSGFTIDIVHDIKTFKKDMVNHTIATAQVIGDYCSGALLFRDNEGAEKILEKLTAVPSIVNAIVYNTNGELFAALAKVDDNLVAPAAFKKQSTQFIDNCLHVFQPIFYNDEFYGMIYLCSSTTLLIEKIMTHLQNMFFLIAGLTIISIFLAFRLQRIISQPILHLANVAKQIAKEENYSIRVQKIGNDETGTLYDGFNNMLDQIQDREKERDKAEATLKKSNEQLSIFQKFAEASIQGMGIADLDGNITYANPALCNILGEDSLDETLGKNVELYYPEELRKKLKNEIIPTVISKDQWVGELPLLSQKGRLTPGIQSIFPILDDSGTAIYLANVITDITERKRIEEELARHREHLEDLVEIRTIELTEANKQLKQEIDERKRAEEELKSTQAQLAQSEKMAALGTLVAGVAHEINTPVGAINSMYDTLMRAVEKLKCTIETTYSEDRKEYQKVSRLFKIIEDANQVIASGTQRVTNIVRRLKSFARLDEAELLEVDIHEGIENTLVIVHHELKHKAVVERNFGDIPPISCYPRQLNQVYLNLLVNAIQAIEDKGTITITTFQKNDYVHIQFKDTGVGIPKERLNKIFDPGYTTKGVGVGTGLGLSICYQIVRDHYGEILVESEVGKGSTFTIILPLTPID